MSLVQVQTENSTLDYASLCTFSVQRPDGFVYEWRMMDPRCQSQPAYFRQIGHGATEEEAQQDYVRLVGAADTGHELKNLAGK